VVILECPQCHLTASAMVQLSPSLTVREDESSLRVTIKQKPTPHMCGQAELHAASDDDGDQPGLFDGAPPEPETGAKVLDWAQRAAGERDDGD
jgi:hypothetical protein